MVCCLRLFIVCVFFCPAAHAWNSDTRDTLTPWVEAFLNDPEIQAPGLQMGVVTAQGSLFLDWGSLWHGRSERPKPNTIYEVASLTKLFTALLLAQAVSERQISLQDPVKPCFQAETSAWCFRGQPLTWGDLLTHSSGLPALPDNLDQSAPQAARSYTPEQLADFLQGFQRKGPAPVDFAYSSLGYGLLGLRLGERAGVSYASQLSDLTAQLGLSDTQLQLSSEQFLRLAPGYIQTQILPYFSDAGGLTASGGLKSSAQDLLHLLAQILELRPSVLSPVLRLSTTLTGRRGAPFCQMAWGWQYFEPQGIYWHSGSATGGKVFLAFDKQAKIGLVLLANARVKGFKMEPLGLKILTLFKQAGEASQRGSE